MSLRPGSRLASICGALEAEEEFTCDYELNPAYRGRFEESGILATAFGERGEIRAVEIAHHRFFIATLFQPQLRPVGAGPHPILTAFVEAAALKPAAA